MDSQAILTQFVEAVEYTQLTAQCFQHIGHIERVGIEEQPVYEQRSIRRLDVQMFVQNVDVVLHFLLEIVADPLHQQRLCLRWEILGSELENLERFFALDFGHTLGSLNTQLLEFPGFQWYDLVAFL